MTMPESMKENELREKIISVLKFYDNFFVSETAMNNGASIATDRILNLVKEAVLEGRNNSLLDLEQWIKLHSLEKDMILDGIEHMVKSNLSVPDQPRLDHTERLAALKSEKGNV